MTLALAAAVGVLFGFVVGFASSVVDRARREAELTLEARRAGLRVYDWAEEVDAVRALRAVCYRTVAYLEGREETAAAARIRAVLEDVEAMEEAW